LIIDVKLVPYHPERAAVYMFDAVFGLAASIAVTFDEKKRPCRSPLVNGLIEIHINSCTYPRYYCSKHTHKYIPLSVEKIEKSILSPLLASCYFPVKAEKLKQLGRDFGGVVSK